MVPAPFLPTLKIIELDLSLYPGPHQSRVDMSKWFVLDRFGGLGPVRRRPSLVSPAVGEKLLRRRVVTPTLSLT